MVATSQPQAALIGLEVLREGGNAIDAAIATNAAMGLMEPSGCGLGGDLFALVWSAREGRLLGLNASGRAPGLASLEAARNLGLTSLPQRGVYALSVPGCVSGWGALQERLGTWSLDRLLRPAIRAAEDGFVVTPRIGWAWERSETVLRADPFGPETFLPGGRAPRSGERFVNPRLAGTLRTLAEQGPDAFYLGELPERIGRHVQSLGGWLRAEDFAAHRADWVDPIGTSFRGVEVWQIPPPGQGLAVLQMLNLLEPFDLEALGPDSPELWHLFLEAKKLAYRDRARLYSDPSFPHEAQDHLVSKAHADRLRAFIHPDRAIPCDANSVPAGPDTIYLTTADADGNMVSLIQSNYMGFGSGVMAADLGFMLQNRGCAFALDESHPNRLEPGKRPFHTIIPGFATRNREPWLAFGVMGGDFQPLGQVQILLGMLCFGRDVSAAGAAPRVDHEGSPTPEGLPGQGVGKTSLEPGFPQTVFEGLKSRGHDVAWSPRNAGGYQAILREGSAYWGASEVRKDGIAVGL